MLRLLLNILARSVQASFAAAWIRLFAMALSLWALAAVIADSTSFGTVSLGVILLVLFLGGLFLLVHGIIDLVRDLRKSIDSRIKLPH